MRWEITPLKRDEWHNRPLPKRYTYRAYTYQEMTAGFAAPKHAPNIPGPTLFGEVGDVLVVHFRNADRRLRQAVTMHPHGVKYNPEYDGPPISPTMPLGQTYENTDALLPFFANLLPEGTLYELTARRWGVKREDRFGVLLRVGADTMGALEILPMEPA